MGLFAQSQTTPQLLDADSLTEDSLPVKTRYTFGDFFDALDLPTVLGVGFTPSSVESTTFNSAMRLGWRHHKNYGTFVYITYDTHSNKYEQLKIDGSNVYSGEVWYNEVGMSVGYRVPLVKDIKAFYQKPYFHPWDFFVSIQPGISIATFKNMVPEFPNFSTSEPLYTMDNVDHIVPTLKISAGVEWFVFHNFAVFSEVAYTQHLMPTLLEKAAMKQYPSGPITLSVGLSLFFN
jgi:hypothetical protein